MGNQSMVEGVNSSPLLSHKAILTDGEGRDTDIKKEKSCCMGKFKILSNDNKDEINLDVDCRVAVEVGDLNPIHEHNFGVKVWGSLEENGSPQSLEAPDRLEKVKKEEVNCIINYLCDSVTEDILKNLLDEIVDREELELQKRLLMKGITNFTNPPKVTDMEALIMELNDKENGETFEALGIEQWVGEKVTLDCAKHCKKRGRKSLLEFRANDGIVEG